MVTDQFNNDVTLWRCSHKISKVDVYMLTRSKSVTIFLMMFQKNLYL